MIDYHVHTNYSADASATVTEQLEAAAERGLSEICFTDHVDFDNGDKSMQHRISVHCENSFCLTTDYIKECAYAAERKLL